MYCLCTIGSMRSVHYTELVAGCLLPRVSNILKSIEKQSGLSELSVILWVSAVGVEGCPLSRVPL